MGKSSPSGSQYSQLPGDEEGEGSSADADYYTPTGIDRPNQLPRYGWWGYLSFSFLNPLLEVGFEAPLQDEDLYDLVRANTPAHNHQRLEKSWSRQKPGRSAVLMRALFGVIGREFVGCAVLKALATGGTFMAPLLLQQMVQLIETGSKEDAWHGYIISLAMFVTALTQTSIEVHYNYQVTTRGLPPTAGVAACTSCPPPFSALNCRAVVR
eukprot:COSAG01_NODE_2438_length_7692_cov_5.703016_1_plen_211_part_00